MEGGAIFLASLFGAFFGTIVLAASMFVFHRIGFLAGKRARTTAPVWAGVVALVFLTLPPSLWPFLTDWDPFLKIGASMACHVTMIFPMAMGYIAARELQDRENRRRWRKNADDWLGRWECDAAPVSSEDEGR
jgi:hypothetical protein